MNRLLEFGRKTMFYIRVLSGYEERRIRSLRLQLEQRVKSAHKEREAIKRMPEQVILSEIRHMVEEMKNLNKSLENADAKIKDYFKPLDKEAEIFMNMQHEKEKAQAKMMENVLKQAMYERAEAEAALQVNEARAIQQAQERAAAEPQKPDQTQPDTEKGEKSQTR